MRKIFKSVSKLVCLLLLIFSVFGIISAYAGEPIFKITGISVKEKSSGTIVNDVDLNDESITNNITFTDKDDYITYDITIKNTSDDKYTIKSVKDDNTSQHLKYEYDDLSNVVLNQNEEKHFDLTITYIKISNDPTLSNNKVNLIITYEKENGEEQEEQITPPIDGDINKDSSNDDSNQNNGSPKTSDNVVMYFIIGSISLIGFIVLSKSKKKNKMVLIIVALLIPICANANTIKLTIEFNNTIKATSYDVTINLGNGSESLIIPISKNGKLTKPSNPTKNGYDFDNWYIEGTSDVYDFDTPITGSISIEARYTISNYSITYDLDEGSVSESNPDNYTIESGDITLNNPTKQGFDFAGWTGTDLSSPTMTVTILSGSTGSKSYTATYTPKTDITYTVYHKYKDLNTNTYTDVYTESKTGTTGETVTLSYRPKTGFVNPTPQKTLTILPDGSANEEYLYARALYKVNITADSSYVSSNITLGSDYEYGTSVTLEAGNKPGNTFVKWSNDETSSTYSFTLSDNVDVYPVYDPENYTVSFFSDGGTDVPSRIRIYDEPLGELDEPTKVGYIFLGWYTDDNGGAKVTKDTLVKGNVTYYAHWEIDGNSSILCQRATELHHETCGRTDGKGCDALGYTPEVDEVYYGSLPSTAIPIAGNAFDCDVNGDGYYDPVDERFYYLRNSDADTAVLVYYNDAINGVSGNNTAVQYEASNKNYVVPTNALSNLPEKTDWINTVLVHDLIQVKTESGASTVTSQNVTYNLPEIDYSNYAARMISIDDVNTACNVTVATNSANGLLDGCTFLLENTTFASPSSATSLYPTPHISAYWVANAASGTSNKVYRVHGSNRTVGNVEANNSTGAGMRPVIEVPMNRMDTTIPANKVTLSFDTRGGTPSYESRIYDQGEIVQELPTPTKSGYTFQGWYTSTSFTEEFTENTEITSNIIIYAKWYLTDAVAELNGEGYSSISSAIEAISDSNPANIKVLKNTSEIVTPITSGVNVEIDLDGHVVTNNGDEAIFTNNGGTLRIKNGNLTTTAQGYAAINCRQPSNNGVTYIDNVTVNANGNRSAVYVEGGTLYLDKGSVLTTSQNLRPTVMNTCSSCKTYIIDAEIISTSEVPVSNKSGTVVIGALDSELNRNTPILRGGKYGIVSNTNISMYDGIIEGKTAPAYNGTLTNSGNNSITYSGSVNNNRIIASETGFIKTTGQETISSDTYNTLYLMAEVGKYQIRFDADGGTVYPDSMLIDQGQSISNLPIPSKGIYHFDGWYDGETQVFDGVEPDGNKVYKAKWSYSSSATPVTHRTTNGVMQVYYSYISTWKNNEATFSDNMINNFNDHNCSCTDNTCSTGGTVYCDKPTGFDTGTKEAVSVYLYDEINNSKGTKVNYAKSSNGVIYNLIPGIKYYWELDSDTNVYGVVIFNSERRIIEAGSLRNVRDLGGLSISYTLDNVTKTGTLKYGKLFRGVKLGTDSNNLTELANLGVTEELELRSASEAGTSDVRLNQIPGKKYIQQELKHYQIDRASHSNYYNMTRGVVKKAMQDIVAGENIYFHCRIGTDRTGTLAYILEGLLGVSDEEKLQDYELSFFYGLVNRTRYYAEDPNSSVSKTEKFVYMYNIIPDNNAIYEWYMEGTDDEQADKDLINSFRTKMIDYN